jgi:hypothetical protein
MEAERFCQIRHRFPGEGREGLIKFQIAGGPCLLRVASDLENSLSVFFCLHQEEGDIFHTFFEKESEAEITSKGPLGDPPVEENDRDSFFATRPEQVGPEFGLRNQEDDRLDFFDGSPNDEGMIDRQKKDSVGFGHAGLGCFIPRGGDRR